MIDTRILSARDDVKASAAALDDARTAVNELLTEGPELSLVDQMLLDIIFKAMEQAVSILDRCVGGLVRIADRWTA